MVRSDLPSFAATFLSAEKAWATSSFACVGLGLGLRLGLGLGLGFGFGLGLGLGLGSGLGSGLGLGLGLGRLEQLGQRGQRRGQLAPRARARPLLLARDPVLDDHRAQ